MANEAITLEGLRNALAATRDWTKNKITNVVDTLPATPVQRMLYWATKGTPVSAPEADKEYQAGLKPAPVFDGLEEYINGNPADWHSAFNGNARGVAHATLSTLFGAMNASMEEEIFTLSEGGDINAFALMGDATSTTLVAAGDFTVNAVQYTGMTCYSLKMSDGALDGTITPADPADFEGTWSFSQADIEAGVVSALFDINTPGGPVYHDGTQWVSIAMPDGDTSELEALIAAQGDRLSALETALSITTEDAEEILNASDGGEG